jgi:hypothetical protein
MRSWALFGREIYTTGRLVRVLTNLSRVSLPISQASAIPDGRCNTF